MPTCSTAVLGARRAAKDGCCQYESSALAEGFTHTPAESIFWCLAVSWLLISGQHCSAGVVLCAVFHGAAGHSWRRVQRPVCKHLHSSLCSLFNMCSSSQDGWRWCVGFSVLAVDALQPTPQHQLSVNSYL
jgi:hypothetical protein